MTDSNGRFEFDNVTSGTYNVTITKDGYQTISQRVTTTAGNASDMGAIVISSASVSTNDAPVEVIVIILVPLLVGVFLVIGRRKK